MAKIGEEVKIKNLEDCNIGDVIAIKAVVSKIKQMDTTGKSYNQTLVTIEDRTGKTVLNMWKTREQVEQDILEGFMYTFHGSVGQFRNINQLNCTSTTIIEDTEENRKKYDPNASKGITEDQEKVFFIMINKMIEDDRYRRLCEVAFGLGKVPEGLDEQEYRERLVRFKKAWCSLNHHDNYSGGLFNHSVGLARIVVSLKRQYNKPMGRHETICDVNWDHLITLSLLHDYEKQKEYVFDIEGNCMYDPEVKINHLIEGVSRINLLDMEVEPELKLTKKEIEDLKYGILCHHGPYGEYELKSIEDRIFHSIDMIDSACVEALRLE